MFGIEATAMNQEIALHIFNGVWVVVIGLWVAWDTISSEGFFDE